MHLIRLTNASERTDKAIKNIILLFAAKAISIICSMLIVPITIEYLNPTRYGVWLTVSSIIAWIGNFDLGLGNGLRNRFADAKAKGDTELARKYVSTTYLTMSVIMVILFLMILVLNAFVDWSNILNLDAGFCQELKLVISILALFFSLNLVVSLFGTVATANQSPALPALINAIGQVVSVLVAWILVKTSDGDGSLLNLALYYSGIPCIVMLIASVFAYTGKYKQYRPSFSCFSLSCVKSVLNLGVNFFIICVSLLLIFQISNIVLMRECGPDSVTRYNIAFKYFNVLCVMYMIIITPFWSAFTDAYAKSDTQWMKSAIKKLEIASACATVLGIAMLFISPAFYSFWIRDNAVTIPFSLSLFMLLFTLSCIWSNMYMYPINGIGAVRIQMCIYLAIALFAWPAISYSARHWGVAGVLIVPTFAYVLQGIMARIQLMKLINGTAKGLYVK